MYFYIIMFDTMQEGPLSTANFSYAGDTTGETWKWSILWEYFLKYLRVLEISYEGGHECMIGLNCLIEKNSFFPLRNRARIVKSSRRKEHKFKVKMLLFHGKKV